MNYTALPHEFGEYTAYFDVEYTVEEDSVEILDFDLSSVVRDDAAVDLRKDPQVRVTATETFSTDLENGKYDSELMLTAILGPRGVYED